MFRTLLVIAVVVLLMVVFGWITFRDSSSQATIAIDKQRVEHDTAVVTEKIERAAGDVTDRVQETLNDRDDDRVVRP